jgi:nucleoside phosphorylase
MRIQGPVDIGIIVALELELKSVLAHLKDYRKVENAQVDVRSYYVGSIKTDAGLIYTVVVTMPSSMGNVTAALATKDLIDRWTPRYLLMIGIAAGANPESQQFGDILVSESIFYYEPAKLRPEGPEHRPRSIPGDPLLLSRVRNLNSPNWQLGIGLPPPKQANASITSKVHIGPIGAGEKVVANAEFVGHLRSLQPKLIGIEMESWGVALAAHEMVPAPGFLAIRGICDFADSKKGDDWQQYAADAAATWAFAFLRGSDLGTSSSQVHNAQAGSGRLVSLRWKAAIGQRFRIRNTESTFQTVRVAGAGEEHEVNPEKIDIEREFIAQVTQVRANGSFRVHLIPEFGRMEKICRAGTLSHSMSRTSDGKIATKSKADIGDTKAEKALAARILNALFMDVLRIEMDLEFSPRGTILYASTSHAPFDSALGMLEKEDPAVKAEIQQVLWLLGPHDSANWLASTVALHFPEDVVGVGAKWAVRRKVPMAGMVLAGVSSATLEDLEFQGNESIAHIHEEFIAEVDATGFDRRMDAMFVARVPGAVPNSKSIAPARAEMISDWVFDVSQGHLLSRSCSKLSLALATHTDVAGNTAGFEFGSDMELSTTFKVSCEAL